MLKPYRAPSLTRHGSLNRLTQGSGGGKTDGKGPKGGGKGGGKGSDRRLKKNIVPLASLGRGFSLYLFDYIHPETEQDQGRQLGVMADEVIDLVPDAVYSVGGFLWVDYVRLNIHTAEVADAFNK
ncbi:MAG: tail fiber domain-containing protein [Proteobacteria bacterium]|nr:tail fiber domain-containing protein [Pseudomonadota bacterium]